MGGGEGVGAPWAQEGDAPRGELPPPFKGGWKALFTSVCLSVCLSIG